MWVYIKDCEGIGLLALQTDTLFTPAPKRDRSFYLKIVDKMHANIWDHCGDIKVGVHQQFRLELAKKSLNYLNL